MESVSAWVPIALMLGGIALIAIGASMGSLLLVIAGLIIAWNWDWHFRRKMNNSNLG